MPPVLLSSLQMLRGRTLPSHDDTTDRELLISREIRSSLRYRTYRSAHPTNPPGEARSAGMAFKQIPVCSQIGSHPSSGSR